MSAALLYPRGKRETPPIQNAEYILCISQFDVRSLPQAQKTIGQLFQSRFAQRLAALSIRERSSGELDSYEKAAWEAARKEAAQKLAAKHSERDGLLYTGLPNWKYKKEIRKIDRELVILKKDLEKAESVKPRIAERPVFKLASREDFPPPPPPDGGEAFLEAQKADAFITAKLSLYYGRIHAEVRLYTRFSAYVYEDEIIFSSEDLSRAVDELAFRLEEAVSGTGRAVLTIAAEPEQSQVLINGKLVVNNEPVVLNPGTTSVFVTAEGYVSEGGELELAPGEHAAADIALSPLNMEKLKITMPFALPDDPPAKIYVGAMYMGELSPSGFFDLSIPDENYRYISVETEDGRAGRAVVLGDNRGEDAVRTMPFRPRLLPGPDEKPVEKRRRQFYGAWGRLWVSLPLAFIVQGFGEAYARGNYASPTTQAVSDRYNYASYGAWGLVGVFAAESIVRLVIYIHTASRESIPLRK